MKHRNLGAKEMIEVRVLNQDPIRDYLEACKITQGVDINFRSGYVPILSYESRLKYWIKQIVANHSTLRFVHFVIKAEAPKTVVMQLIRATKGHPQPEVQSSRPDWNNGKERSSDPYEPILFMQEHTAESFVEMAKQRLCNRTEDKTREFMMQIVSALRDSGSSFLEAVAYCCKPACEWYGKCPEIKSCGKCSSLSQKFIEDFETYERNYRRF